MVYEGSIVYRMKKDHPDWTCSDQDEQKVYEFRDEYTFDSSIYSSDDEDDIIAYISCDLKLVAGGGYDANSIDVVDMQIERVA